MRPSPLDLQLTTVAFVCNFEQESIPGGCVPPAFVIPGCRVSGGTLPPGYPSPSRYPTPKILSAWVPCLLSGYPSPLNTLPPEGT